jgi:hypothetical protein
MSDDGSIIQDCRDGEREEAFRDWLAEASCSDLRDIIESQSDNVVVQEGLLTLLISLSDRDLTHFICEYCETADLRAEFDALPNPSGRAGVNPQNA